MSSSHELFTTAPKEWGRWGPHDEIGRANLLDESTVLAAAAECIRTGKRFSLALPLCHPGGDPCLPGRTPAERRVHSDESHYREGNLTPLRGGAQFVDDSLMLSCHGTTHMDALGHAYADKKLWNGYDADFTIGGLARAGVDALAHKGIVGRAVLVDVARHEGVAHLEMHRQVTLDQIRETLLHQGTQLARGDVLLIRTGIFNVFYEQGPAAFYESFDEPGLTYEPGLLDFLSEYDIVGLGSDTLCNERQYCDALAADFPLHVLLQRNLGITFHEALWLEAWAADCADDRAYSAFYVAAPLNLVHASGAPMNPIVIK